jgi:hypothetical protein
MHTKPLDMWALTLPVPRDRPQNWPPKPPEPPRRVSRADVLRLLAERRRKADHPGQRPRPLLELCAFNGIKKNQLRG